MNVDIEKAANLIRDGETVGIPTETVYGLAADAFNVNAVKKIFEQKGRPAENPLIVHISDDSHLEILAAKIPDDAKKLADRFWPGPLSIILQKQAGVPDIVTGGLGTVAIRMPGHPLTLSLIEKTGPLTAPSANKSGRPSPTHPRHIEQDFGEDFPVLNGGSSSIGLESTVLDLTGDFPTILRPGFVDAKMIKDVLGKKVLIPDKSDESSKGKSPGTRFTHYKPMAAVHWVEPADLQTFRSDSYYLLHSQHFGIPEEKNVHAYNGNYKFFARDLYDHFRTADHLSCSDIFVEPFDNSIQHPLIPALKDRIEKAISS